MSISDETTLEFSGDDLEILAENEVQPEASARGLSRRTVVRGGASAWGTLAVLGAATAPAFAASPQPPKFGELSACKLPGRPRKFAYRFTVPYTETLELISIVSVTLNGNDATVTSIEATGKNLVFEVESTNSADASGNGVITYIFMGQAMTVPFVYDGTKPCKI